MSKLDENIPVASPPQKKKKTKRERELIFTTSITKELIINGMKTWVGVSTEWLREEMGLVDGIDWVNNVVDDWAETKGATAVMVKPDRYDNSPKESLPVTEEEWIFNDYLEWKDFKTKEVTTGAGWAWVDNRNNPEAAKALLNSIKKGQTRIRMNGDLFEVGLSKDERFFTRNLPKRRGASSH